MVTKASKSTAVVSLADEMAKQLAGLNKRTSAPKGSTVRLTQDKKFKMPDGTMATQLDVVIVDFNTRYEFYDQAYDSNNPAPAVCTAIGTDNDSLRPLATSPMAQSDECSTCSQNVFGSGPNGSGKACRNQRVLALLPVNAKPDTPIMVVKVSPTAIGGFDSYVRNVADSFGTPPIGVITTISFNPAKSFASLQFGNSAPNPNLAVHFARQGEAQAILSAAPDMTVREKPVAMPVGRGRAPVRAGAGGVARR